MTKDLMLLVDVDGVVTDEHARVDRQLIAMLLKLAQAGAGLAFISGRSRRWLEAQLGDEVIGAASGSLRFQVSVAAEMGALRRGRTTGHQWEVPPEHAVPAALRARLLPLLKTHSLANLVEWDATKEATATFESIHRPDVPGHAEHARQALASLLPDCQRLAAEYRCRAAMSTYALDVLAPNLSKAVGTSFALEDIGGDPEHILVLGDSAGDVVMAETAHELLPSARVDFAWVGRGTPPLLPPGVGLITAPELHASGTKAVLTRLLEDV